MTPLQIAQIAAIVLAGIGTLFGGIGFAIYSYRKSGRQERKDVTDTADVISEFWKNQADELKLILQTKDAEFQSQITALTKDFNEKIQELTKQLGVLTGQLTAEKALNEKLEKIFQNRNPEMEGFMKYMVDATEKHSETHEAMLKVLADLHGMVDSRRQNVTIKGSMESKPQEK